MGCKNLPIQVIVLCDEEGIQHPLKFQFQDQHQCIHTVQIHQVIDTRTAGGPSDRSLVYLCKAFYQQKECLFELKYGIEDQRWALFRQIY